MNSHLEYLNNGAKMGIVEKATLGIEVHISSVGIYILRVEIYVLGSDIYLGC